MLGRTPNDEDKPSVDVPTDGARVGGSNHADRAGQSSQRTLFFWDGERAMTHEESKRRVRLMGEEVIPALKECARERLVSRILSKPTPVGSAIGFSRRAIQPRCEINRSLTMHRQAGSPGLRRRCLPSEDGRRRVAGVTTGSATQIDESITVAGGAVLYLRKGGGPPLVVLHHSIVSVGWLPPCEQLAQRFTVYVPNLPGFGRSELPGWARNVRDIAILTQLTLDGLVLDRVTLMGFGFGCWVAAEMVTISQRPFGWLLLNGAAGI